MTDPSKKHEYIRWNPELSQWFCIQCGRTSDHQALPDARVELEQFECKLPSVRFTVQFACRSLLEAFAPIAIQQPRGASFAAQILRHVHSLPAEVRDQRAILSTPDFLYT